MKIALDVDGVLLNTKKKIAEIYNRFSGSNIDQTFITDWNMNNLRLSKRKIKKLWSVLAKEIEDIEPIDSFARFYTTILKQKHTIDIVTNTVATKSRMLKKLEQIGLREGKEYNKFVLTSDWQYDKSKLDYDVYIDDNPNLAEKIEKNEGKVILLYDQPYNKYINQSKNVWRVYNWDEIVEAIRLLERRKSIYVSN